MMKTVRAGVRADHKTVDQAAKWRKVGQTGTDSTTIMLIMM